MPNKLLNSFFWKYLERSGTQLAQFALTIVLARMLAPADFGALALVMVFIAVANVLVESGLKSALVQKKNADATDFSTAYWLSFLIAVAAYTVLYFSSPAIAAFYKNESLAPVVRVLGLTLFIGALSAVLEAYIQKNFLFRAMFLRSLSAAIPSGILGIILAYYGLGIWALVWQQLANAFLSCVFMLFIVPWKPTFEFSFPGAKRLFGFGSKIMLSSLYYAICVNLTNLLIGKIFSPAMLGFYNRGEQFPRFIVSNVNQSVNAVLLPTFSNVQNDIAQLRQSVRRSVKTLAFVIFPVMALLASSARPTVELVLGENWLSCVVFLQVNCFLFAFWPLRTANQIAISSLGRSGLFLKIEVAFGTIGIVAVAAALYFFRTPLAVVWSQALIIPVGFWLNSYPNGKLIGYGFIDQVKDISPMLFCSAIAGTSVFPLSLLALPNFAAVTLQVVLGLAVYWLLAKVFKLESLEFLCDVFKGFRKDRNPK